MAARIPGMILCNKIEGKMYQNLQQYCDTASYNCNQSDHDFAA